MPILSSLIIQSALGAGILFSIPDRLKALAQGVSGFLVLASLYLGYAMLLEFDSGLAGFQLIERTPWIESFGMEYHLGVDGISVALIEITLLTNALLIACHHILIDEKIPAYLGCFFFMQAVIVGVFSALDAMLFYLFWEATLLPLFLCIGIWGSQGRFKAAYKFFLYTFFASAPFLLAILYLGVKSDTFDLESFFTLTLSWSEQVAIFLACTLAFAVKVPMWPVHTWLPDAHTEAPAGGSVMLAALMLKVGAFGFYRFNLPIVPDASAYFAGPMVALSIFAIVFVGLVTLMQTDIKRLIAYASIAHMGIVTLGIFIIFLLSENTRQEAGMLGLQGSVIQMIAHAFSSGGLFLAFGIMYRKIHSRQIQDYGGLASSMPILTVLFLIFAMSNLGLPGTGGFVGELMVILASYQSHMLLALAASVTLVLSAAYTLWMVKRVFYGPIHNPALAQVEDIGAVETCVLGVFALAVIALGLYPNALIALTAQSCQDVIFLALGFQV